MKQSERCHPRCPSYQTKTCYNDGAKMPMIVKKIKRSRISNKDGHWNSCPVGMTCCRGNCDGLHVASDPWDNVVAVFTD